MPKLIEVPHFQDERGQLTVIQDELGFEIKRIFYITKAKGIRGGHGHKVTKQALVALNGRIQIRGQTPNKNFSFILDRPEQVLILNPEDWHEMLDFSSGSVLLVVSSHAFMKDDYIQEPYRK